MSAYINGTIDNGKSRTSVRTESGMRILDVLRAAGAEISAPCGGNGTCGKCRVRVAGVLSEMGDDERRFLDENEISRGVRLACKCRVLGDFEVHLTDDALHVETDSKAVSYTLSPMIRAVRDTVKTTFFFNGAPLDTAAPDTANLGLAVDIGTTTVAVYLCDMDTGEVVEKRGFRNPQSSYGADVISRIDKIMKAPAVLKEEQRLIIDAIGRTAAELCAACGGTSSDVRAAVFCGNTVMQHLAAGIDPSSIARAPFIAPTLFGEFYRADAVGLPIFPAAPIYFAPCFASYVGGDIACGMIAAGLDRPSDNVLFIDIGTNGEIGLSTKNGLYFCSAAAGPAFEGAHIECGMAGTVGAVSEIFLDGEGIAYRTIGGVAPTGICGSGIIDAAAVMLDAGLLDETGRIADKDEAGKYASYIDEDADGGPIFVIDAAHSVYMTGTDIREVQLAKAAICAGIYTLLDKAGLSLSEVTSVVLAGGFGSHINKASACRIGLIPRELAGKIVSAGNTAGAGAVAILLGKEPREAAGTICGKSDYTELSQSAFFMEKYIEEMMFEETIDE